MEERQGFPMMPEKSWWALRQQFKKTIPSTLSVSYLKSLLGLTSDQSARNLLSPLKQMKIIDDDGKPSPRANDWRNDNKYQTVCQEILQEIYPWASCKFNCRIVHVKLLRNYDASAAYISFAVL